MSFKKNIKLLLAVSALNTGITAIASTTNCSYDFSSQKDDNLSSVLDSMKTDHETSLMGHDKGHQKTHDKDHAKGGW